MDLLITSQYLIPTRRHVTTETVVVWMEMEATCLDSGGIAPVDAAQPYPLLPHPDDARRWGAWYIWTGLPMQVQLSWTDGTSGCLGAGPQCGAIPTDPLDADGPWIEPGVWYRDNWLPVAPDSATWETGLFPP